jgi:hypothetical protein
MSYSSALAFHNMSNVEKLRFIGGSVTSWTDPQKLTSIMELCITEDSGMHSNAFISNLASLAYVALINCEIVNVDVLNPLIIAVSLKQLLIRNTKDQRSVAVDFLSGVARRTKQLPARSFQLEGLSVDSISAVLVAPICSLLAATLEELDIFYDKRVESLTDEEEKALQLLTSLRTLGFRFCPGLLTLPQGLHCLSSLRGLNVEKCPEIQSLPKGGLPSSLYEIKVTSCSAELQEQVKRLKGTNPKFRVNA